MSPPTDLGAIEAITRSHPLWGHPFLARCRSGSIDAHETRVLTRQMYKFSREFSRFLANILAHCTDEHAMVVIAENLFDELGEGHVARTHPALFRRFTRAVGVSDEALDATPAEPETAALIRTYMELPGRYGHVAALGAVCFASEGIVSSLYAQIQNGICGAAPIAKEDLIFFDLHISVDVGHAAKLREVVASIIRTSGADPRIAAAVGEAMDARVRFFDGVARRAMLPSLLPPIRRSLLPASRISIAPPA
jgi:pyrroloquinoline-quinone synthase